MGDFQVICGVCSGITIFVMIIILITSFSSLSTNEYGLNYSKISEQIEPQLYTAGFYFLGIGHEFITFPKSVITVDFSNDRDSDYPPISSRTSDGLEVSIEVSFQYTLNPQKLYDLYNEFNKDYKLILDKIAIDILNSNTTEYSAYNFFWNRSQISNNMQYQLNKYFEKWCFSQIEFFQLKTVNLPSKFEDSIQQTEVTKQSIQQAEANKDKTKISLKTDLMKSQFQKNVTENIAEGDAQQILLQAKADAQSILAVQKQNSLAYGKLKKQLNLSNSGLLSYVKNKVVRQNKDSLTVSFQDLQQGNCINKQ